MTPPKLTPAPADNAQALPGGEMGARLRAFDWAAHPLGPRDQWPAVLQSTVALLLLSPLPMVVLWGAQGFMLYNDGYAALSGNHHPGQLGTPVCQAWPEISDFNRQVLAAGLRGEPLSYKELPLVLHRHGRPEETWMDLTSSPLLDERGQPGGVFAVVTESTVRVNQSRLRERAERHLREARERIQLALDAGAVVGTWVWDVPRDHFTADATFARAFAMHPTHLAEGRPLAEVVRSIHPEDQARVGALRAESLRLGGRYRAEYRTHQPDGSWRWFEANGRCEHDAEGRPLRMLGVLLDIDARKTIESRQAFLLSFADRMRSLSDPRDILSTALELLGGQLQANRAGYAELDLGALTSKGLACWTDGTVEPRQGIISLDAYYGGQVVERLRQGRTVVCADVTRELPATAPLLAASDIASLVSVPLMRDLRPRGVLYLQNKKARAWRPEEVTLVEEVATRTWEAVERARAETALRGLNAQLERQMEERTRERNRLWELSEAPFLIADREGRWLHVSPAWSLLLGWTEEELLGRTSEWMEHPEDRLRTRAEVLDLSEGQKTLRFENRIRHRDGGYRWFSWVAVPSDGLLYCVARDVTEERQREQELERTQEQLRQSQKMEAVGQLTGGIAHDFNNLLAGIQGSLELLERRLEGSPDASVRRYIEAATTSARRAATLTHRLLAFARRQSLDVRPTDLNALVRSLEELLRRTLGENVALESSLQEGLWVARTDTNQFENALLNLAINARDAMPHGGRLTLETENVHLDGTRAPGLEELAPGDYVVMSVRDTGTGMPPEVVAKAFEPFFTTKPMGQGTGLGLSMIYGFAKQTGGQVHIDSAVGRGTTVRLYLPRQVQEIAAPPPKLFGEAPRALEGETVLVVEDEPAVRMVVVDVLQDLGYHTLEAGDAQQALPHIEGSERLDLLVTDVGLPGMNGRQLADLARQRRPGLKVLFATGYAESAAVRDGILEPGMEIITKPFSIAALAARLRVMLGRS